MDFTKPVRLFISDRVSKVTFRTRGPETDNTLPINRAKLTTSTAHGLAVGDLVQVDSVSTGTADTGGNIGYDGRHVVVSVPSSTTFTYTSIGISEASTAVTAGIAVKLETINLNELADVRGGPRTVTGFKLEQVNYNTANIEGYVDKRALRDGLDYTEPYLSARTMQIGLGVYGETLGDFWDQMDKLTKALAPNAIAFEKDYGVRPLRFYQPTRTGFESYPSGIDMEINVRPTTLVQFGVTRSMSTGLEANGYAQRVTANLMMPDPRKYHYNLRNIGEPHRGSMPTYAIISGSGYASDTKITVTWYSGGKTNVVALIVGRGHWKIDLDRIATMGKVRILHQETVGDFMVHPGPTTLVSVTSVLYADIQAAIGGPSDQPNGNPVVRLQYQEAWL